MSDKIKIEVEAETASFINDMKRSGDAVERFGHRAEGARVPLDMFKRGFEFAGGVETFRKGLELAEEGLEQIKEAFEETGKIGREAMKLDISVEDMSRFEHAANSAHVDVSTLTAGMNKLNVEIGKVASGDAGAKEAADALGKLGLNARELANANPAETFKQVSDSLAKVTDGYERAVIVQSLMGRGGKELIPIMAELRERMDESDRIGFTRTADNVRAVEEAEKELAKTTDGVKGVFMDLATSTWSKRLLDEIDDVATQWREMLDGMQRRNAIQSDAAELDALRHQIRTIKEDRAAAARAGADGVENQEKAERHLIETLKQKQEVVTRLRANLSATDADVQIGRGTVDSIYKQIKAEEEHLHAIQEQADAHKAAADAAREQADAEQKGWENAEKALAEMQKQALQANMTRDQKELDNFVRTPGVDDAQVREFEHWQKTRDAIEDMKKGGEEAKRLWEDAMTPQQKYLAHLKELDKLMKDHLLTEDQYLSLRKKAMDDYEKMQLKGIPDLKPENDRDRHRQASAITRSFDFRYAGGQSGDKQTELVNVQKTIADRLSRWDDMIRQIWQAQTGTLASQQPDNVMDLS